MIWELIFLYYKKKYTKIANEIIDDLEFNFLFNIIKK